MSFNANIPQTTDKTLQSYFQLRANFQAIADAMSANHAPLTGNPTLAGKHTFVILQTTTDPATSSSQVALYNKLVSSIPQIFFRPSNSQTPIQLTYNSVITGNNGATPPVYIEKQQSFVAGPFVFYFGIIKSPNTITGTVITLLPASNLLYVGLTPTNTFGSQGLASFAATNITGNQFTMYQAPAVFILSDVYYVAIGLP